jgi:hypothetical protein
MQEVWAWLQSGPGVLSTYLIALTVHLAWGSVDFTRKERAPGLAGWRFQRWGSVRRAR